MTSLRLAKLFPFRAQQAIGKQQNIVYNSKRFVYNQISESQSYVERGYRYEKLSISVLSKFGFNVLHTGMAGDKGIDFQGFWNLTNPETKKTKQVVIVGQCKYEKKEVGPVYIRELDGVVARKTIERIHLNSDKSGLIQEDDVNETPTIGILISYSGFTAKSKEYFQNSHQPLIISVIEEIRKTGKEDEGRIAQFQLNRKAQELLPDVHVGITHAEAETVNRIGARKFDKVITIFYEGNELYCSS